MNMVFTDRCVNCTISLNNHRMVYREVLGLDTPLRDLLITWTSLVEVLPEHRVCQPCVTALQLQTQNNETFRAYGHKSVCLGCGVSVLRARSIPLNRNREELTIIRSWIPNIQFDLPIFSRICRRCWRRATRVQAAIVAATEHYIEHSSPDADTEMIMRGHNSCCVVNCKNTGRNSDCKFYRFPQTSWKREQRVMWILAVNRKNADGSLWFPKPSDKICSAHFIGGKKADEQNSPSYVPSIFPAPCSSKRLPKQNKSDGRSRKAASAKSASTSVQPATKLVSRSLGRQSNTAVIYLKESENVLEKFNAIDNTETIPLDHKTKDQAEVKTEPPDLEFRQCSKCNETISGFVWACVQCGSRSCTSCFARGQHDAHYVLRAPLHATFQELESVLCKVREALSSVPLISRADSPPCVPDIEQNVAGEQSEFEVIKMEIKVETDEIQAPIVEEPSTSSSTVDRIPRDPLDGAENAALSNLEDDKESIASSQSSETLTASDPSDLSSADSEDEESLAPSDEKQLIWTPDMNKYLVRLHMSLSKVEKKRSRVYSRIKQAFAIAYKVKVSKSQLEAQRKIILNKLLLPEDDVDAIVNERPFFCDLTVGNEVVVKEMDANVSEETPGDDKVTLSDDKVIFSYDKVTLGDVKVTLGDNTVTSDNATVISGDSESDTEHMHQFLCDHQYFSVNKRNKNKRKRVEKDAQRAWSSGEPAPVP